VTLQPLTAVTLGSESELVVGDHVVFYNHATYDALTENDPDVWKLENAIIVDGGGAGCCSRGTATRTRSRRAR